MSDNLTIFGNVYEGVNTLTFTDTSSQQKVYINTADADATAMDILSGKTAYINNTKVTGTIAFKPAQTYTPGTINQTISAGYFLSGDQTIAGDANLVAENIAQGVSIFGVEGTHSGGGGTNAEKGLIEKTISGSYYNSEVTSIGSYTFYYCISLTTVSFPACTNINPNAFAYCSSLITVSFPACMSIGQSAFYYCRNLTEVNFPACTSINSKAFMYCSHLTTINFPVCTSIGYSAFRSCSSLTTVSFPICKNIEPDAFNDCRNLTTINFPECMSIGGYAFEYCFSLTTVSFPKCTNIGYSVFADCTNLTTVSFPMCKVIGVSAFFRCISLTTVSFPACTNIDNMAFYSCINLLSAYFMGSSIPSLANSNAFNSTPIAGYTASTNGVYGSIYVPASMLESYKTATNWAYFSSRFVGVE